MAQDEEEVTIPYISGQSFILNGMGNMMEK